ncbi:MAG: hypothetical protein ACI9SY_000564 [Candidatus Paceibacteria bacterium]|jgi:hypothetical protein
MPPPDDSAGLDFMFNLKKKKSTSIYPIGFLLVMIVGGALLALAI